MPKKTSPSSPYSSATNQRPLVWIGFQPAGRTYLRGVLKGIGRYARGQGGWEFLLPNYFGTGSGGNRQSGGALGNILGSPDGIIVGIRPESRDDVLRRIRECGGKGVIIGSEGLDTGLPTAYCDPADMASVAVDQLVEQGFTSLGFFGHGDPSRRDVRRMEFGTRQRAGQRLCAFEEFYVGERTRQRGSWRIEDQIEDLADWVEHRPGPLGVICSDDEHAWRTVIACRKRGISVPQQVSVIGVGNDEFFCESLSPTISSVAIPAERIGYRAAQMLHDLWQWHSARTVAVEPLGVVTRESSSISAVTDPNVARAVEYIWAHVEEGVTIPEVARAAAMSERTLLRHFKNVLGRTPGEEIRRSRVETARRLLTATDMPLAQIAVASGLGLPSQLSRTIRDATGHSPTELRRQYRSL
jgi:LacI family transcriptional regulator